MTFQNALKEARRRKTVSRTHGGMVLYMKLDEYGFLRTGIVMKGAADIFWFSSARLREEDFDATNWEVIK